MSDHNSQSSRIKLLNEQIVGCRLCPRLVEWREAIGAAKKKAYSDCEYWAKPVPVFGDFEADRLIVGLAPAAHGGNRTGRMFTGDRSGDWIFRALHKVGLANQASSTHVGDGLELRGALIAATAHCAPPANKLLPDEIAACSRHLKQVLELRVWRSILCLGGIAWGNVFRQNGLKTPKFSHCATARLGSGTLVVGSYHPSQQNTFTGKLTESMLDEAVRLFANA